METWSEYDIIRDDKQSGARLKKHSAANQWQVDGRNNEDINYKTEN